MKTLITILITVSLYIGCSNPVTPTPQTDTLYTISVSVTDSVQNLVYDKTVIIQHIQIPDSSLRWFGLGEDEYKLELHATWTVQTNHHIIMFYGTDLSKHSTLEGYSWHFTAKFRNSCIIYGVSY